MGAGLPLRHQPCDLAAALDARIDQTLCGEFLQCIPVIGEMLRLPPRGVLPGDAEPGEVLIDRGLEFRPASGSVDGPDAQQESTAAPSRGIEIHERRISVAEMQVAVRARREAEDAWRHYPGLVMPGPVPAIHVLQQCGTKVAMLKSCSSGRTPYKNVDGRDKPGHDEELRSC